MFALDMILWGGLFFGMFRFNKASRAETPRDPAVAGTGFRSKIVDLAVVSFFGFFGLAGIGVFAKLFDTNLGQCLVEGLTCHGSLFLLVAGAMLFWKRRRIIGTAAALFGLFLFGVGFDMLVVEPYSLAVEHYEIRSPKLKNPVRIVFVADIQTDRIGRHERRTLETIREQNPDLIILGGDYLQYYEDAPRNMDLPQRFRDLFLEIPLSAPLGVFAITGNVDPMNNRSFGEYFKETTVEPIYFSEIFENVGIDKKRGPIDIAFLSMSDSVEGVGENVLTDTGNFLVMVGHYPNYAIKNFRNSDRAPDLMLAGHTHGGQVALPWYGPIRIKRTGREKIITRDFLRGMKTFSNGGQLLISRGTGMERGWAPRVRFFCRPEISVIDLIPESSPE